MLAVFPLQFVSIQPMAADTCALQQVRSVITTDQTGLHPQWPPHADILKINEEIIHYYFH